MKKRHQPPATAYLSPEEVADILHVKVVTLTGWRYKGKHPELTFTKKGHRVVYDKAVVEAFDRDVWTRGGLCSTAQYKEERQYE